jgi:MFS family permease
MAPGRFSFGRSVKVLFILIISSCATSLLQGSRLTVMLFALSLEARPLTVGLLSALYTVLPVFVGLAIGRAVDRLGTIRPLLLCGVMSIGGHLLPFAFPQLWSLALSAGIIGLAFITMSICLNAAVPQMGSAEERTSLYAWYALGSSLGMAYGPLLSGFGIEHLGHRAAFLLLMLTPVILLATLAWGRRFCPPAVPRTAHAAARLRDVLREPGVPIPLLGSAMAPVVLDLFFFALPLYANGIGISASAIGIILGSSSLSAMAVRALLPLLVARLPAWTMVASSFATTGTILVLLPHSPGTPMLIVLAVLAGISTGVSAPIVISLLYSSLPQGRQAEVLGVRAVMMSGGQAVVPTLVGGLSAVVGLAPVLAICGAGIILFGWRAYQERGSRL